jgi:uncharacterized protein YyaL (SSP411 family)
MLPLVLAITLAAPAADQALYERLSAQVEAGWDAEHHAFIEKGGTPSSSALELSVRRAAEGGEGWRERASGTMAFTWTLYDSVGGGFVHSQKSANPAHPSFDKRGDSNAHRLSNLVDLMQAGYGDHSAERAAQVIDYFDRVLLDGRGGFMPSQSGDRYLLPEINGLAIHAWVRWCALTGDTRRRDFALKSLDRVWNVTWDARFGLMRKGDFDTYISPPLLIDQVEAGRACLVTSQIVGRDIDRKRAVQLGEVILGRFVDPKTGGFYTRSVPDKKGDIKKAPLLAAENARAARFLCELSAATGEPRYREAARRAWTAFEDKFEKQTFTEAADWALAVRESFDPTVHARADWPEPEAREARPRSKRFR